MNNPKPQFVPPDIETLKKNIFRPKRAVVTGGMPYANGMVHLGHVAGALVPPDIYARWLRMLIGDDRVMFVSGSDDHGSPSEVVAMRAGRPIRELIDEIHAKQSETMRRYNISYNNYSGTSKDEAFPVHKDVCQDFIRRIHKNGLLEKKTSLQWFDPKLNRFLQDRFVNGKCPNPKCTNDKAYSDECEVCGTHYDPAELIEPRSALSDAVPELRETTHWWLDMWKVSEPLREWTESKNGKWRGPVYNEVIGTVLPALRFDQHTFEAKYKELKPTLAKHKSKYAAGKKILVQCENKRDLHSVQESLESNGIKTELADDWAHRSISRDVAWGIPMPIDVDPDMKGKTLYVWPDSLIAPISFTQVALKKQGRSVEEMKDFWRDPEARIYQFLGQDNVYFYTLMQSAMWLGTQADPMKQPQKGDYQFSDVFSVFHLLVNGEKMSKSTGNFFTGDEMIVDKGYTADQLRYFLALLSLPEKASNFDFHMLDERNKFLAGPMNAAFEKPISACHTKFGGKIPDGKLNPKVLDESTKMIQKYLKSMEKAEYSTLLYAIENYARQINSMFTQFKPHDDRFPEEQRRDALFSCFYVLKNIMIMLYPFVPGTMDKVRESLRLSEDVFKVDELGIAIPAGHAIGEKQQFFPACGDAVASTAE